MSKFINVLEQTTYIKMNYLKFAVTNMISRGNTSTHSRDRLSSNIGRALYKTIGWTKYTYGTQSQLIVFKVVSHSLAITLSDYAS